MASQISKVPAVVFSGFGEIPAFRNNQLLLHLGVDDRQRTLQRCQREISEAISSRYTDIPALHSWSLEGKVLLHTEKVLQKSTGDAHSAVRYTCIRTTCNSQADNFPAFSLAYTQTQFST